MAEDTWKFIRPDWTRPEGYEFVKRLTHAQMAWEFLRRRKRYRNDYVGFLDPAPVAERRRALSTLDEGAPLRWFVPKNGGARYGKIEQTLGDFVRAVNHAGKDDPRFFLRARKANPQRYTIKHFADPNLSPLNDKSLFIENFIQFRSAKEIEEWGDEEKLDFLDLNAFQIAIKVDLRFPAVKTIELIRRALAGHRKVPRTAKDSLSHKPKKNERSLLLRVLDSHQAKLELDPVRKDLTIAQVAAMIFPRQSSVDLERKYNRLLDSAEKASKSSYKYIARI